MRFLKRPVAFRQNVQLSTETEKKNQQKYDLKIEIQREMA